MGLRVKMILLTGQKKNRQAAFTLIEIILVVIVLSIIAGFAVPNFSKTYAYIQLQRSAQDLAYLMRYAQSRAVTKNTTVRLQFDEDFSAYWLAEKIKDEEEAEEEEFKRISSRLGKTVKIPSGLKIEMEEEVDSLNFYPDGSIDKKAINVCNEKSCFVVSTEEKRGDVQVFQE